MRSIERRGDAQCRVAGEKRRERYREKENRGGMMNFRAVKRAVDTQPHRLHTAW